MCGQEGAGRQCAAIGEGHEFPLFTAPRGAAVDARFPVDDRPAEDTDAHFIGFLVEDSLESRSEPAPADLAAVVNLLSDVGVIERIPALPSALAPSRANSVLPPHRCALEPLGRSWHLPPNGGPAITAPGRPRHGARLPNGGSVRARHTE